MCFHQHQSSQASKLEHRFRATFIENEHYQPLNEINGFSYPQTPCITNDNRQQIQMAHWGLIPKWAKEINIREYTLNAKIETWHEKPSYKGHINNRCLVLLDGYYEWKWLDIKGRKKEKYLIRMIDQEPFAVGGIWNEWLDPKTKIKKLTYTIVTQQANEQLAEIHNSKKRMPIILSKESEDKWLLGETPKFETQMNITKIGEPD